MFCKIIKYFIFSIEGIFLVHLSPPNLCTYLFIVADDWVEKLAAAISCPGYKRGHLWRSRSGRCPTALYNSRVVTFLDI